MTLMLVSSLLAHAAALAIFGPYWLSDDEPLPPVPADENELVVEATYEELDESSEPETVEPELVEPEVAERVPVEPLPEEPEPEQPEEKPPIETVELNRKVVEQETNEEMPVEADYLSDQANKVEEETRAEDTSTQDAEASKEDREEGGEPPPELATLMEPPPEFVPRQPEPQPREASEPAEPDQPTGQNPVIVPQRPRPDARQLLIPDMQMYERVFAERDRQAAEHAKEHGKGKVLFEHFEDNQAAVKASLENFIQEVRPGNHTGVNAHPAVYASYIGAIHRKIHVRWANHYLMDLDLREPAGSSLNDPQLNTKLEFVIRASDGEVEAVNVVNSSGEVRFDAQALSIAHRIGPHPDPPPEIVSPDGRVYIHWNFWRDQRQCGTFGASVYVVQNEQPG